jgi:hypothetical protein
MCMGRTPVNLDMFRHTAGLLLPVCLLRSHLSCPITFPTNRWDFSRGKCLDRWKIGGPQPGNGQEESQLFNPPLVHAISVPAVDSNCRPWCQLVGIARGDGVVEVLDADGTTAVPGSTADSKKGAISAAKSTASSPGKAGSKSRTTSSRGGASSKGRGQGPAGKGTTREGVGPPGSNGGLAGDATAEVQGEGGSGIIRGDQSDIPQQQQGVDNEAPVPAGAGGSAGDAGGDSGDLSSSRGGSQQPLTGATGGLASQEPASLLDSLARLRLSPVALLSGSWMGQAEYGRQQGGHTRPCSALCFAQAPPGFSAGESTGCNSLQQPSNMQQEHTGRDGAQGDGLQGASTNSSAAAASGCNPGTWRAAGGGGPPAARRDAADGRVGGQPAAAQEQQGDGGPSFVISGGEDRRLLVWRLRHGDGAAGEFDAPGSSGYTAAGVKVWEVGHGRKINALAAGGGSLAGHVFVADTSRAVSLYRMGL